MTRRPLYPPHDPMLGDVVFLRGGGPEWLNRGASPLGYFTWVDAIVTMVAVFAVGVAFAVVTA